MLQLTLDSSVIAASTISDPNSLSMHCTSVGSSEDGEKEGEDSSAGGRERDGGGEVANRAQ